MNPVIFGAAAQSSINANQGKATTTLEWVVSIVCTVMIVGSVFVAPKLEAKFGIGITVMMYIVWMLLCLVVAVLVVRLLR